ncbi:MAG TPA: Asd/ArgC dimerization domain-containing protein [Bryobacteraceae bacterium]|nr:Asd/ArgC dimerization domain-containing protein [Bryobacteraceae bacterium]
MAKTQTLALVGSESLIGREIRDLLSGNSLGQNLKLIAAGAEETGKLTEQGGEPAFVLGLERESLEAAQVIFLAGTPESAQKAREIAPRAQLIDLTNALEDAPQARLRAPMVEPPGYQVPADSVHVIANAAAIAITLVLSRLDTAQRITRALAHVFEPASQRGAHGVEELQQQTIGLLSFKGQPKEIFDAQLAFNLLPRYGGEAPVALEESELRIERHLATLLAHSGHARIPSLRLIQAPVFHGYSISLWVEFESNPGIAMMEATLEGDDVDLRRGDTEPPDAVGMAGQSGLAIGSMALDRNNPRAAWLWIVTDNLRLQSENAVSVAQQLL